MDDNSAASKGLHRIKPAKEIFQPAHSAGLQVLCHQCFQAGISPRNSSPKTPTPNRSPTSNTKSTTEKKQHPTPQHQPQTSQLSKRRRAAPLGRGKNARKRSWLQLGLQESQLPASCSRMVTIHVRHFVVHSGFGVAGAVLE